MRICAVTTFPPSISGVADYGQLLSAELARHPRVSRVTVLADRSGRPDRESHGAADVRRAWSRDSLGAASLLREIEQVDPDVVWFNFGLTMFGTHPISVLSGLSMPLLVRARGRRVVVTIHELPSLADLAALAVPRMRGRLAGWAAVRLLLCADRVIVTLDRYRRHLLARHGAHNVTHIPHGLWCRPEPLADGDAATVLVFGTFGPHKDPRLALDAVRRIRASGRPVRLVVAGTDNPRFPGFMSDIRAQLDGNDEWAGYVPSSSLCKLFARATLVVIPSTASTGASGVIHRAIGHAKPLVVSDLPDFRALADEEDLALQWSAPGDGAGLASAIERLLDDRELRERLVAHNMRAAARLAPDRTADAYVRLFGHAAPRASPVPTPRTPLTRLEA